MQTPGLKYLHLFSGGGVPGSATDRQPAFQVLPPLRRMPAFAGSFLLHGAVCLFSLVFSEFSVPEPDSGIRPRYSLRVLNLRPTPVPFDLQGGLFRPPRLTLDDFDAKNTPEPLPEQSIQDESRRQRLQQWLMEIEAGILAGELTVDAEDAAEVTPHPVIFFVPSGESKLSDLQSSAAADPRAGNAGVPHPLVPPPLLAPEVTEDFKASLGHIVSLLNRSLPARPMAPPPPGPVFATRTPAVAALPPPPIAPKAIPGGGLPALGVQLPAQGAPGVGTASRAPGHRMAVQAIVSTPPTADGGRRAAMPDAPVLGAPPLAGTAIAVLAGTLPPALPGGMPQPGASQSIALPGPKSVRIVKPQNGRFSTVTSSSASAVAFPGTEGLLHGNVVNTAYVNVGLKKNWILQYVVSSGENVTGGAVAPTDAPWPWIIERPEEVSFGGNDYVIVHGFIRASGHLEDMAMQQTEAFPGSEFLMKLLSNWEFRPASRGGAPATVEILLIIPSIPK